MRHREREEGKRRESKGGEEKGGERKRERKIVTSYPPLIKKL